MGFRFSPASKELIGFADLHCHMLSKVDDGPQTENEMYQMLATAYKDGVRAICFTPHYPTNHDHQDAVAFAFEQAQEFVKTNCPDLTLTLGNEILCNHATLADLQTGKCRPLGNTKNVLVEFYSDVAFETLRSHLHTLLSAGYQPILAHAENYIALRDISQAAVLRQSGVLFQVNASTILNRSFFWKQWVQRMLDFGLVDLVADDCHDLEERIPNLSNAYRLIRKKYSPALADFLFKQNPAELMGIIPPQQQPPFHQ